MLVKIKLIVVMIMFCSTAFSQTRISLSPQISAELPKGAAPFDDKAYKGSMKGFETLTKDIYKIDHIVMQLIVANGERSADYISTQKKEDDIFYEKKMILGQLSDFHYTSQVKEINGNETLIQNYKTKTIGTYKGTTYLAKIKKIVLIKVEYKLIEGEKEKAFDILNGLLKSIEYRL